MRTLIISLMFTLLLALATTVVPFAQPDGEGTTSVVYANDAQEQEGDNGENVEDEDCDPVFSCNSP